MVLRRNFKKNSGFVGNNNLPCSVRTMRWTQALAKELSH
jgi:hypothetical protein